MPRRILIIDPDEDQLTELRLILEEQGCSVETACDGWEGLQKGKLFQPDLVITELLLNRLSGFEVSSRIAGDAGFQAPVIFYTGFYRDEYARKEVTSKYGAVDYFIKPFQREGLKKAVAAILSQKEATMPVVLQRLESTALAGSLDEKIQSLEPHEEDEVGETPQPAHDSESWLQGMETAQQSSPLSAVDEVTRQADRNQETIIAPAETVSPKEGPHQSQPEEKTAARRFARPVSPEPELGLTANQVVPAVSNELSILSSARKPPTTLSIYKSRPIQVIAIMTVLFLVFLWLEGRIPYFEKKDDYMTLAVRKESIAVQPSPQVGPSPTLAGGAPSPGSSLEPVKEKPAPMPSSTPADKNLGSNATVETSSSVASHTREKRSTRSSLRREVRNASGRPANWVINDVTGTGKSPFLRKSRRPVLPLEMIQAPNKPVVIRIVISQEGKVLEATPINEDESNVSLSQAALAVVQDWEFEPIRTGDEKTWTKYFSFRLTRESD